MSIRYILDSLKKETPPTAVQVVDRNIGSHFSAIQFIIPATAARRCARRTYRMLKSWELITVIKY